MEAGSGMWLGRGPSADHLHVYRICRDMVAVMSLMRFRKFGSRGELVGLVALSSGVVRYRNCCAELGNVWGRHRLLQGSWYWEF